MSGTFLPSSSPSAGLTAIGNALDQWRRRQEWNDRFKHWERPASVSEEGTIERAQANVQMALKNNLWLSSEGVVIRRQGSYENNTNVRTEADIDLRAVHPSIKVEYDPNVDQLCAKSLVPYSDSGKTYSQIFTQMRDELVIDLSAKFGGRNITLGNKAIRVAGITGSRAEVDVVPTIHYHYVVWVPHLSKYNVIEGVAILAQGGTWTYNFPDQHTANGIAKRSRTSLRFKKIVRIFKRLRTDMAERKLLNVKIPSFLVECLIYLVEDDYFLVETDDSYDRVRRVALRLQELMTSPSGTAKMTEINQIKWLFHPSQAWRQEDAKIFVNTVVAYLGTA